MIKVLELFGGIGACTKAFKRLGIPIEVVDYVEIDKYAVASYNVINGTNFEPQDIKEWDKNINVDFIMHGSPCQDFSVAGQNKGGDEGSGTRSSLMYETIRIVKKLKPKYVIWENVKNLLSKNHIHNFNKYVNIMYEWGYNSYYKVLNSKDYGIPQNRERVFTISIRQDIDQGFKFPEKEELKLRLRDMLEDKVDKKYYLRGEISNTLLARDYKDAKCIQVVNLFGGKWDKIYESNRRVYSNEGLSPTIHTCLGGNTEPKVLIKNNTKQGYLEAYEGDGIYTNTSTKRGTVQKQMIPALTGFQDNGVVERIKVIGNYSPSNYDASRVVDNNGLAPTVKENHGIVTATNIGLRIRKLTPKECWRLMGFDDSDFDKAVKVNSNSQLYKQAGNSIVVNVLEKILENLFLKVENDFEGQITFEMLGGNK